MSEPATLPASDDGPAPAATPCTLLEACHTLLRLTRAQAEALATEDLAAFERLADARDALLPRLAGAIPSGPMVAEMRALLHEVAALDQQNLALAQRLLADTARALQNVRQGQTALHGYGRPGARRTAPSALDREC